MRRLVLAGLLFGCTEPKKATTEGLWRGEPAGRVTYLRVTTESPVDGSINIGGGPLCNLTGLIRYPDGDVDMTFSNCIQPAGPLITFFGTLDGDTMTGTLSGWQFSSTPVTFTR